MFRKQLTAPDQFHRHFQRALPNPNLLRNTPQRLYVCFASSNYGSKDRNPAVKQITTGLCLFRVKT